MSDLSESALEESLLAIQQFRNQAGLHASCRPTKILIPGDPLHKENEYDLIERSYLYWCYCRECRFHLILGSSLRTLKPDSIVLFRIITKNGRFPGRWMNRKRINKWHFIKKNREEAINSIKRRKYFVKKINTMPDDDRFGLDGEEY